MKKERLALFVLIILILIILAVAVLLQFNILNITGNVVQEGPPAGADTESHTIGPSQAEQDCMRTCASVGCQPNDMTCMQANSDKCVAQCNVKKTEQTSDSQCMEQCISKGCDEFDFACQTKNQGVCEQECNMIKGPETKSEEEQCIRDCVNLHAKGTICKPSQEGEKGDEICQMCAQQCVHLYSGPCLDDKKLKSKQKECETCEHCYGEPITGPSGQGWDCIVNVECKDASAEFGDNPGIGEGIKVVGEAIGNAIGNAVKKIGDFIGGLFGRGEEEQSQPQSTNQENSLQESNQPAEADNSQNSAE